MNEGLGLNILFMIVFALAPARIPLPFLRVPDAPEAVAVRYKTRCSLCNIGVYEV